MTDESGPTEFSGRATISANGANSTHAAREGLGGLGSGGSRMRSASSGVGVSVGVASGARAHAHPYQVPAGLGIGAGFGLGLNLGAAKDESPGLRRRTLSLNNQPAPPPHNHDSHNNHNHNHNINNINFLHSHNNSNANVNGELPNPSGQVRDFSSEVHLSTTASMPESTTSTSASSSLSAPLPSSLSTATPTVSESKRLNYPPEVRAILLKWLGQNREYPYPTDADKNDLASKTGLTLQQVNNWFINARRRKYQYMLEDVSAGLAAVAHSGSPGSGGGSFSSSHTGSFGSADVGGVGLGIGNHSQTNGSLESSPRGSTMGNSVGTGSLLHPTSASSSSLHPTGSNPVLLRGRASSGVAGSAASTSSSLLRASFSSTAAAAGGGIMTEADRRMALAGMGPGRRRAYSGNAASSLSGTPPSHSPYWKTAAESLAQQQQQVQGQGQGHQGQSQISGRPSFSGKVSALFHVNEGHEGGVSSVGSGGSGRGAGSSLLGHGNNQTYHMQGGAPIVITKGPSPLGLDRPTRDLYFRQQQQQQQQHQQQQQQQHQGISHPPKNLQHQPYTLPAYNLSGTSSVIVGSSMTLPPPSQALSQAANPANISGTATHTLPIPASQPFIVKPYVLGAGAGGGASSSVLKPLGPAPISLVLPLPQRHDSQTGSGQLGGAGGYMTGDGVRDTTASGTGESGTSLAPLVFIQDGLNAAMSVGQGRPRLESMFAKLSTEGLQNTEGVQTESSQSTRPMLGAMTNGNGDGDTIVAMDGVESTGVESDSPQIAPVEIVTENGDSMDEDYAAKQVSMRWKERDAIWGI